MSNIRHFFTLKLTVQATLRESSPASRTGSCRPDVLMSYLAWLLITLSLALTLALPPVPDSFDRSALLLSLQPSQPRA